MGQASELARRLAHEAEAVCRAYLSKGRRNGNYWMVGDVNNTPGRSLYVRLKGGEYGRGACGHWRDSATGEYGDLLDLIARAKNFTSLGETLDEARAFLALPRPDANPAPPPAPAGSPEAAKRLFHAGRPVPGTLAEAYLRARSITAPLAWPSLRYHPSVYYRPEGMARTGPPELWPALLAAVTDAAGRLTGLQRTWLDRTKPAKAPFPEPRRAMGHLLGNGVRLGPAHDVLAAGEGVETMLALKSVLPHLPMIAALSANHLAALDLPAHICRLYIAQDNDTAGRSAARRLRERSARAGIEVRDFLPLFEDFNADLIRLGPRHMLRLLLPQLALIDRIPTESGAAVGEAATA